MIGDDHRTKIEQLNNEWKLNYSDNFWCIGSCFANHLFQYLSKFKFATRPHPYGIVYNPMAIANQIVQVVNANMYTQDDLVSYKDIWSSRMHHSDYNGMNLDDVLNRINYEIKESNKNIRNINCLIITLGTSYVYRELITDEDVSNCHKRPGNLFKKRLCTVDEMTSSLERAISLVRNINPDVKIIFSISPIRHVKNGLINDQRSKAALILVAHTLCDILGNATYFPSFEIMMSDLRDYRYYERDMIHPSELAVDYILGNFKNKYFNSDTIQLMREMNRVFSDLAHKPFNPMSADHLEFKNQVANKIYALIGAYPNLNFDKEIEGLNLPT